ncbi:MAG: hypothetical protein K2X48_19670, partial [Chitinophagaceae bacterium]|nr:hypothetical protein [Chitinophagaceae bacterium]
IRIKKAYLIPAFLTKMSQPKSGRGNIYFSNPAVGDLTCTVNADWPYKVEFFAGPKRNLSPNAWILITVDTATYGKSGPSGMKGEINNNSKPGVDEPIPTIINFDWQVTQRMRKDEDDDDNNGKAYNEVTYYYTSNGDYAAVKPEDKSFSLMVYSKKGHTWMFDDKKKIITVMNMPKTVGEGGMMGKAIAEKINKAPIAKDKDDESFTITKTGKTKNILGYTADEYVLKSDKVISSDMSSKTGTASFWYAKVPFDPVKIYTMGVGRPPDLSKIQNDPKMKNNLFAIPILNKNYLWIETEAGNIKGLETTEIKKVNNTINTAGYKIKVMNSLKDMFKGEDDN